jgi:hypothetical protein
LTPIFNAKATNTNDEEPATVPKMFRSERFQFSDVRVPRIWCFGSPVRCRCERGVSATSVL